MIIIVIRKIDGWIFIMIVRKLNTSINHLLLWLCAASLLEATLGILAKCIIIGIIRLIIIRRSRLKL